MNFELVYKLMVLMMKDAECCVVVDNYGVTAKTHYEYLVWVSLLI